MLHERRLDAGEVELNLAVGPDTGPPLVLLHGVTRRWQDYVPLLPGLLPRWQVYALDFRGHGLSGRKPGHYLAFDHARDAIALLRELGTPAVVYGHSLGALVAIVVAAEAPELVRAIVLEDPPGPRLLARLQETPFFAMFTGIRDITRGGGSVEELSRKLTDLPIPTPNGPPVRLGDVRDASAIRFTARCLRDLDPEVLTPILERHLLEGIDLRGQMVRVGCPALLLRADEAFGGMLLGNEAAEAVRLFRDVVLIERRGVGHLIHWQETDATLRFLLGFLEAL
jgi:pimeloyl-ACP methyl ester carboxylesterase